MSLDIWTAEYFDSENGGFIQRICFQASCRRHAEQLARLGRKRVYMEYYKIHGAGYFRKGISWKISLL